MTLADIEQYFESLCVANKLVKHGVNNRAWIPFGSEESPEKNAKIKSPYVQHSYFFGGGLNHTQWVYTSELFFLVNISPYKGNIEEQMNQARDKAHKILLQFDAKIISDNETGVTCHLFEDLQEAEMEPLDLVNQLETGWIYRIRMIVDRKNVNQNDWEVTP
jgi:hypothetical protein